MVLSLHTQDDPSHAPAPSASVCGPHADLTRMPSVDGMEWLLGLPALSSLRAVLGRRLAFLGCPSCADSCRLCSSPT